MENREKKERKFRMKGIRKVGNEKKERSKSVLLFKSNVNKAIVAHSIFATCLDAIGLWLGKAAFYASENISYGNHKSHLSDIHQWRRSE